MFNIIFLIIGTSRAVLGCRFRRLTLRSVTGPAQRAGPYLSGLSSSDFNAGFGPAIMAVMRLLSDCVLYTFVDTAYLRGRAPEWVAQQLCDGGSDLIQLRAKNSSPEEVRRLAEAILPVTRRAGVGLVINDHPAIAMEMGAEYCHLGQEDFFDGGYTHVSQISEMRARTGAHSGGDSIPPLHEPQSATSPQPSPPLRSGEGDGILGVGSEVQCAKLVAGNSHPQERENLSQSSNARLKMGLSTHAPAQAERALAAKPDYIAIGPVYATGTKPGAKPVTLEYVRWAAANVSIPWFAIGGINLENLGEVLAAGARRICVVSAILNAPDIAQACREFRASILRLRKLQ